MRNILVLVIVAVNAWAGVRAGAATTDITPPVGAAMAGYFYNRSATGVHDPLLARALVLESGGLRIALVSCDLTSMPEGIVNAVRGEVARQTGIAPSHVMVSATHAHTAPVVLSGWTRYKLEGEMRKIAEEYTARLPLLIASSVVEAVGKLRPARVLSTTGREETLAHNRRYHMRDGSVSWNPGKLNPNVVRTAGPIDPALPLVYVEGEDGQAIAAYVNYAMHLDTVGGTEFSADLVYALGEALRLARGKQLVTLFTMGCAGNVNHIDTGSRVAQSGQGEAARIGTVLAGVVLQSISRLELVEDLRLSARTERVTLAAVVATEAELAAAKLLLSRYGKTSAGTTTEMARASRVLEVAERNGHPFEVEVQVLRLGRDLAWVGLPGEIFVEHGLELKLKSQARWTIVVTQANGALGYVPDRKAYAQGAYEVLSARVVEGSGEKLVEKALEMIVEGKKQ